MWGVRRPDQVGALVGCAALGFVVGMVGIAATHVKVLAESAPPAQAAPAARVFASDAGLVLNFIKPDKTADFETVVGKLKEALQQSDKPERKQQAAAWRVFRAVEPGANGAILYIFDIDPAIHGADYTVSTILAEAFPKEVDDLYKRYADAYASGQNVVNLTLVTALGQ
jgi:23S rRNA G2069 N7-methylase RlmK/C1962 C5-methylase RlmI